MPVTESTFIHQVVVSWEDIYLQNKRLKNAKSKKIFCHDKSSHEGNAIKNVTIPFGLQQIIKEDTHISNTLSSCIDLIFTSQPNLITGSGVHSSLHSNNHHQFLQNWTYMLYVLHLIYERSGTTEKQTQGLLDIPSKNLTGKEHFQTQALMKKLIFLIELFLIFLVTLFHMK